MSTKVLPFLFEKRWTGTFKEANKFSEHDNYNVIQNFGEYLDSGFGRKYLEDKNHKSNSIFFSKEPFSKRDSSVISKNSLDSDNLSAINKRFPKNHTTKVLCANSVNSKYDLADYLLRKKNFTSDKSLKLESDIYKTIKYPHLVATEPFRQTWISPWKYSYKKRDYGQCSEQFKRVKSSCIDLSKY